MSDWIKLSQNKPNHGDLIVVPSGFLGYMAGEYDSKSSYCVNRNIGRWVEFDFYMPFEKHPEELPQSETTYRKLLEKNDD